MSVASTDHYIIRRVMNLDNHDSDEQLKNTNPLRYYLKHIGNDKIMEGLRWDNPMLYRKVHRIHYIRSFKTKEPLWKCPHCGEVITQDEWGEEYCPECGEVTRNNYNYTSGFKHDLRYGLKIV